MCVFWASLGQIFPICCSRVSVRAIVCMRVCLVSDSGVFPGPIMSWLTHCFSLPFVTTFYNVSVHSAQMRSAS